MATVSRGARYQQAVVDGSTARELSWEQQRRVQELSHSAKENGLGNPKTHTRKKASSVAVKAIRQRAREETQGRARVSVFTVALVGIFVAMMVMVVMNHLNLVMISNSTVDLQTSLETEQTQNAALTAQYQQMFDLASVKTAAEAAGMVKPGSGQVYYFTAAARDETIVYRPESSGLLKTMGTSVRNAVQDFWKDFGKSEDSDSLIGPQQSEAVAIITKASRGKTETSPTEQTRSEHSEHDMPANETNETQVNSVHIMDKTEQTATDETRIIGPQYIEAAENTSYEPSVSNQDDSQKVTMPEGIENVVMPATVLRPEG